MLALTVLYEQYSLDSGSSASPKSRCSKPLHPTPYTLHPKPYTLHPTTFTLYPTPFTLTLVACAAELGWIALYSTSKSEIVWASDLGRGRGMNRVNDVACLPI